MRRHERSHAERHEAGACPVWSWCTTETWERREDEPTSTVLVHARHTGLVGAAGDVEVVVMVRAVDRDAPEIVMSMEEQGDDVPARSFGEPEEVAARLGAAEVQEVVQALAEAVEHVAEQSVATPTLRDIRRAAGTSRACR